MGLSLTKINRKVNNLISDQVFVILSTLAMLGVGIWGVTELETKFEAEWFLPPDSDLIKWFDASKKYFPTDGVQVSLNNTSMFSS